MLKHRGIRRERFRSNPEERAFSDAWEVFARNNLKYLISNEDFPPTPTQDMATAVACVVQWLGSPVGQAFLRNLGYVKVKP